MKTNQLMLRQMGDFNVTQRTKDGMFNATALLKQWNKSAGSKKEVKDFFDNKGTKDFISVLNNDEEFLDGGNSPYVKSKASRGTNAGTWMHPYLFIKFSMWLNPKFELTVIKFVYDELIKNRHHAGDNYRALSSSGLKLPGYNFSQVATALNWIVFNKKKKNLRQSASAEELRELASIEENLAFSIDMGYISSYKDLLASLRKMYATKHLNNPI